MSRLSFESLLLFFIFTMSVMWFDSIDAKSIHAASVPTPTWTITPLPTPTKIATATYVPLPTITLQFPEVTQTEGIKLIEHSANQVPPKGTSFSYKRLFYSLLPIDVLIILWMIIVGWFLISQYLTNKDNKD